MPVPDIELRYVARLRPHHYRPKDPINLDLGGDVGVWDIIDERFVRYNHATEKWEPETVE